MSVEEIEIDANLKWLAARGVTDYKTRQAAKRKAARAAIRKFDAFVQSFDEFEMLDDLWIDGTHTKLSPRIKEEERRIRCKLVAIENYIKRNTP